MTVFNEKFPYSVSRCDRFRQVTVAACADLETAVRVYNEMRRDNPCEIFTYHRVC